VKSAGSFKVYVPPKVTSFSPGSGPVGTVVTVNGSEFANISSVRLGTRALPFQIVNPTRLRLTITPGATSGKITVVTVGGVGISAGTFKVTPAITRLTPDKGAVGTTVLIDGSNLQGTTRVKFNGVAATSVTVLAPSRVRVTVPSGATTGKVTLTNSEGTATSAGVFTVLASAPAA
jgi:hypothetical protein